MWSIRNAVSQKGDSKGKENRMIELYCWILKSLFSSSKNEIILIREGFKVYT